MQAKMDQLLHHREELCFDEVSPENPTQVGMLQYWHLGYSFFPGSGRQIRFFLSGTLFKFKARIREKLYYELCWLVKRKDSSNRFRGKYLKQVINKTDDFFSCQVELGLRLKSQSILESIRHIIEEDE